MNLKKSPVALFARHASSKSLNVNTDRNKFKKKIIVNAFPFKRSNTQSVKLLPTLNSRKMSIKETKAFNSILNNYFKGQRENKKSMKKLKRFKSVIKINIEAIRSILGKNSNSDNKITSLYVKYVKDHKPLFIYGPTGSGRYINGKGVDPLKIRDVIATANAECNFLRPRLAEFYTKSKGII